jgi:uncharacterized protein (TIGR00730 family)
MPPYEIGDADLDGRIRALAADAVANHPHEHGDADLIAEMMVSALKLFRDDADRGDLKLVNAALKEMRYSFLVFSRYRDVRKVTIFGSARTPPGDPNYEMASEFARIMSDERSWMVITGAGPGIMEAGNRGAGIDNSFGVNIRLPFEADANPYIHESRLVNFKYFFTRKLIFMKESHAFALFPGGFGTLDESFELLTLIQTGKSDMHPIVLIEAPGTDYWQGWLDFVGDRLLANRMIAASDLGLIRHATSVPEAVEEICRFYGRRSPGLALHAGPRARRRRPSQRGVLRPARRRDDRSDRGHRRREGRRRPSRTPPAAAALRSPIVRAPPGHDRRAQYAGRHRREG